MARSNAKEDRQKSTKETIEVPAEKAYYLMQTQVLEELREKLMAWFKKEIRISFILFPS